jgi:hypothetical protein
LAADLALGKTRPSLRQAAAITGASLTYAKAARKVAYEQPHLRLSYELGVEPLIKSKSVVEIMARRWSALSEAERIDFVKLIGPDVTFDVAVAAA